MLAEAEPYRDQNKLLLKFFRVEWNYYNSCDDLAERGATRLVPAPLCPNKVDLEKAKRESKLLLMIKSRIRQHTEFPRAAEHR